MTLRNPKFQPTKLVLHHTLETALLSEFFDGYRLPGIFVDIGANRPHNAVSKPLKDNGRSGVVVEPIPDNAQQLLRAGWPNVEEIALTSPEAAKSRFVGFHLAGDGGEHSSLSLHGINPLSRQQKTIKVKLGTLEELLLKHGITDINLLSIDTEGTELDILRGINFHAHRIDLILCEDWQRNVKLHRYLVSNGFKLIMRTGFNSWYVPRDIEISIPLLGRLNLWKKLYLSSHLKRFHHWRSLRRAKKNQKVSLNM